MPAEPDRVARDDRAPQPGGHLHPCVTGGRDHDAHGATLGRLVDFLKGTGLEWRLGVVLDDELQCLGQLAPVNALGERQGHVDPGRDPGAADVIALPDHAVGDDLRPIGANDIAKGPMG